VFLDLREGLLADYLEAGLLALAFHPDYARNRQFFTYRTLRGPRSDGQFATFDVLARHTTFPDNPDLADPTSEARLISQEDESSTHNGGDLAFGPDGYLYLSLGDERPPSDQTTGDRQPMNLFFGALLRLDVDRLPGNPPPNPHPGVDPTLYAIPADNPFHGLTQYPGATIDPLTVRTEFYALGFRNPWRMAFDPLSGELLLGDVGASTYEELNRIRSGANYGWPYREGHERGIYWFLAPDHLDFEPPYHVHRHGSALQEGNSVVAGVFYHGTLLPDLKGTHVFGDIRSGHTWALHPPVGNSPPHAQWLATKPGITSYALDPRDNEILAAHYRSGRVLRLVTPATHPVPEVPTTLSATGVLTDLTQLTPHPDFRAYTINAPFWSDHALKQRWVATPPHQPVHLAPTLAPHAAPGTVWIKHFDFETIDGLPSSQRRLETRLLVRTEDGAYGVTYRWKADHSDALLVPPEGLDEPIEVQRDGQTFTQVWHYPGRAECLRCHTPDAGFALGFSVEQLNHPACPDPRADPALPQLTQLQAWDIAPSNLPPAHTLPALVPPADPIYPLELRARSYLTSNCSSCHRPGQLSDTTARWLAAYHLPLNTTALLDGRLCLPGLPVDSRLLHVVARTAVDLVMPPLASNVIDQEAVNLLSRWIKALPGAPWSRTDFGTPSLPGSATIEPDLTVVSSTGHGPAGDSPSFHLLQRRLDNDGVLSVRLEKPPQTSPNTAFAGLAFTTESAALPSYFIGLNGAGRLQRLRTPSEIIGLNSAVLDPAPTLRITRSGSQVTAAAFDTALTPDPVLTETIDLGQSNPIQVGLTASSGGAIQHHHGRFRELRWGQSQWTSPFPETPFAFGEQVPLILDVQVEGTDIASVEFVANDQSLALLHSPPYHWVWTQPAPGNYHVTARVITTDGLQWENRPLPVTVLPPPASVLFREVDAETQGDWPQSHGLSGYHLSSQHSLLPDGFQLHLPEDRFVLLDEASTDPRDLLPPGTSSSSHRLASGWFSQESIEFLLQPPPDTTWQVALYFVDRSSEGHGHQSVELFDAYTGQRLDQQDLSHFQDGVYLVWRLRQTVRFRITPLAAETPATFAGVFLERRPDTADPVQLILPPPGSTHLLPQPLLLHASPGNLNHPTVTVEFVFNDTVVASASQPDFRTSWERPLAGDYEVFARVTDSLGRTNESERARIQIVLPPSSATLVGTEPGMQGDWIGRVGSAGAIIAPEHVHLPTSIHAEVLRGRPFRWVPTQGAQFDRRAPLTLHGTREAACWTDIESVRIQLRLLDGRPYLLTLYSLDWDTNLRWQTIDILEPLTRQVLASRTIDQFYQGSHLSFIVQGALEIQVRPETINAVVSALFLDPLADNTQSPPVWGPLHGSPERLSLSWKGPSGATYRLWHNANPSTPWLPIPSVITGVYGQYQVTDPLPFTPFPTEQFYRLELLSVPDPLPVPNPVFQQLPLP
jgi:hypothetical protein